MRFGLKGAICGINFTASHNPPEYNGMKLSTGDGAPALPEITKHVEESDFREHTASRLQAKPASRRVVRRIRRGRHIWRISRPKINFDLIADAGGRYAFDPLWGTGRGYLDEALRSHGLEVETIHDWRDVLFGGRSPEPEARISMNCASCFVKEMRLGPGDRRRWRSVWGNRLQTAIHNSESIDRCCSLIILLSRETGSGAWRAQLQLRIWSIGSRKLAVCQFMKRQWVSNSSEN